MQDFLSWLRKQMLSLDRLQKSRKKSAAGKGCKRIVIEAGNMAAAYGLPDLFRESHRIQPNYIDAKAFLASCIAACRPVEKPQGKFLRVVEAAQQFNLSKRTIYRLIEDGLPHVKARGTIRIKPMDLERYLQHEETLFG
jgi:excisionase family DNA binding protein